MVRSKKVAAPVEKVRKQHIRMTPEERRTMLLGVAYKLAKKCGVSGLTRRAVITAADVSESLPNRYWPGGVEDMRTDVLREAVAQKDAKMLADAAPDYELSMLGMPRSLEREVKRLCNA